MMDDGRRWFMLVLLLYRDRVAEMIKDRSGTGIDFSVRLCKIGRGGKGRGSYWFDW